MTLKEYLRREQARDPGPPGAIRRLAVRAGVRWQTVQWLAQGRCRNPKAETLLRVARATAGAVSADDLMAARRGPAGKLARKRARR